MKLLSITTICAAAAWTGAPLAAATTTGLVTVSLTVEPSCTVDPGRMDFGTARGDAPVGQAQTVLAMRCTPGTPYTVTMDEGRNGGRRMADASGANFLDYEVYQDPQQQRRWGSGSETTVGGTAPEDGRIVLAAYGRIIGRAEVLPGNYTDVVTVMVSF